MPATKPTTWLPATLDFDVFERYWLITALIDRVNLVGKYFDIPIYFSFKTSAIKDRHLLINDHYLLMGSLGSFAISLYQKL